jgi:hypothetical protein
MRLPRLFARFPRSARVLLWVEGALLVILCSTLFWLWRSLPDEGVKLHGNVDTGVDLLGARRDLLWVGAFGVLVVTINATLAWIVAPREEAAPLFLIGMSLPILALLLAAVFFLARLNRLA